MFDNLMAPHKATPEELAEEKEKAEATKNMNWREKKAYLEKRKKNKKPRPPAPVSEDAIRKFDEGIKAYKKILNDDLLHLEKKYGSLLTQMHPEDVLPQLNDDVFTVGDGIQPGHHSDGHVRQTVFRPGEQRGPAFP